MPYINGCFSVIRQWRQRVLPWGHIDTTWRIRLNLCIFGPREATTETANWSVQPHVCTDDRGVQSHILYNCLPVPQSKLPLPMLASRPHVIRGSLGPPESGMPRTTWSFQPFLQGSVTWQTDRATDRQCYSVQCGVIMRSYVGYGKATYSFHVSTNNFATV